MNKKCSENSKLAVVLLASAACVAGLAAFLYYNEDARETVEGMVNREKAKYFVRSRLNGNEALVEAVDHMSDEEVNTIMKLAGGAKKATNKTSDAFEAVINRAKDLGSDVSEVVSDYFN